MFFSGILFPAALSCVFLALSALVIFVLSRD